jgi:hypothetical protein
MITKLYTNFGTDASRNIIRNAMFYAITKINHTPPPPPVRLFPLFFFLACAAIFLAGTYPARAAVFFSLFSLFLFPFSLSAIKAGWGEEEYGRNKRAGGRGKEEKRAERRRGRGREAIKSNCVEHLIIKGTLLPKQKPVLCRNWMESSGMKEGKKDRAERTFRSFLFWHNPFGY